MFCLYVLDCKLFKAATVSHSMSYKAHCRCTDSCVLVSVATVTINHF